MNVATSSPTLLLYAGCALAACLILFMQRTVRRLVADTRRWQAVFPRSHARLPFNPPHSNPLTLPLGAALPGFRAYRVDSSGGAVERQALVGEPATLVLLTASQFEQWNPQVAVSMLSSFLAGGRAYVILAAGRDADATCPLLQALRDSGLAKHVVLAADRDGSMWSALGVEHTPCAIQIDDACILQRVGVLTLERTESGVVENVANA